MPTTPQAYLVLLAYASFALPVCNVLVSTHQISCVLSTCCSPAAAGSLVSWSQSLDDIFAMKQKLMFKTFLKTLGCLEVSTGKIFHL